MVDGDFAIWDSHTICAYLVDKYGKDDALYPKDLQLRARCNQRLFFDAASLFVRLRDCSVHVFYQKGKKIPEDKIEPMYAAYDILEVFLAKDPFLVGNNLTIADISVSITVLLLQVYAPVMETKYPKITAWLKRISKTIPFFDELNASSTEQYGQMVKGALAKNNQS